MEKKEMVEEIALAKAKIFMTGKAEDTGLLDFLKNGFTGLNDLHEDQLKKIHTDLCQEKTPPVKVTAPIEEVPLLPNVFAAVEPKNSVMLERGFEIVAANIMVILSRTGNNFRELTWDEYAKERKKDKDFSEGERQYFVGVIGYCKDADVAILLSPNWAALKKS